MKAVIGTRPGARRPRRARGYTLIEVLVGSVLVSVAILGVVQAVGQSSRIAKRDFLRRRAYQYLEQILERPEHGYRGNYYLLARQGDGPLTPAVTPPHDLGQVCLDDRDTQDDADDLMADISLMVESIPSAAIDPFDKGTPASVPALKLSALIEWQFQGTTEHETLQTIVTLVDIN